MAATPLRILQIMRAPVGGLFRHVADLTRELAARGHQIGLIVDSLVSDEATEQKLAGIEGAVSLGIHRFPMPRVLGLADLTTPPKIRSLAKEMGATVLHGHGAKGGVSARLARAKGQIALYTPHGGVLHYKPTSPAGIVFRQIEKTLLRRTDAVIFESEFAKQAFSTQIVAPTCAAPVIHNGLGAREFLPVQQGEEADFVFVGELRSLKGIHVLVEALPMVRHADGRATTLVMAGGGSERAELERHIEQLKIGDRVKLVGVQPARSMFARGRCVIVPSLAESLPYIVLEAAAAGMPLIASRVGGIPEIFGPTSPSLVPVGDVEALARAMQGFIDDPAKANLEGYDRLAHVSERFSLSRMTDQIEALYFKLLGQP